MASLPANAISKSGIDETPVFSVVIPTYNRVDALKRVLSAWEAQVPVDISFEAVVVDDGSEDETALFLESISSARFSLRTDFQVNSGPAAARNRGLRMAKGKYLLFTGDDIEPAPNLLRSHLEEHRRLADDRWAVLGRIDWASDLQLTSTMKHVDGVGAQQFGFHYMRGGKEYDFRHFYTSNVSVSRDLLAKEPSGFSTDFPLAAFEDAEYAYRLRRHGLRIIYQASARAWHNHPYNVGAFFLRQVACGQMAAVLIRKWPRTRSLIGGDAVVRGRRRMRFALPPRRRRLTIIAQQLDDWEERAVVLASAFDRPATSFIDPLLRGLFQYAYLKGLSSATVPPAIARRLCASWFLEHVGEGVRRLVDGLPAWDGNMESEVLYPLLKPFIDASILG